MSRSSRFRAQLFKQLGLDLFDANADAILKALEELEKSGLSVIEAAMRFRRDNEGKYWFQISSAKIDKLQEQIAAGLAPIGAAVAAGIAPAAQVAVGAVNAFGAEIAGATGSEIQRAMISGAWLRAKEAHALRLSSEFTQPAGNQIYRLLHDSWESPAGMDNLEAQMREALGITESPRDAYMRALRATKGAESAAARNRAITEMLKDNRSAANSIRRIIRTESAGIHDLAFDEWSAENADLVTAEEFRPEATACDECQALAGVYHLGMGPSIPGDTHPNCNCVVEPLIDGYDAAPLAADLAKGKTALSNRREALGRAQERREARGRSGILLFKGAL